MSGGRLSVALGLLAIGAIASLARQVEQPDLRPRRLYFGAPPQTPHEPDASWADCLSCHDGTSADAPQTPHPTQTRCLQCHIEARPDVGLFRANDLTPLTRPSLDTEAVGPPPMRHPVLLHEDCLACHAPGARDAIVPTPHPERPGCGLCHRPQRAD